MADNEGEELHAVGGRTDQAEAVPAINESHRGFPFAPSAGIVVMVEAQRDGLVTGDDVLLGNVGFLDHFTVTASRFSQAVAVEDRDGFDDRFGVVLA